jgi:hypothetical protein
MAPNIPLYAWAVPAFVPESPVDHTWVTTYDNRVNVYPNVQQVAAAGEFYWYCWGSFHPSGGTPGNPKGFLGQQSGDLALARCLVQPNADSQVVPAARGTIFTYGIDGVCHQLANQYCIAPVAQALRRSPSGTPAAIWRAFLFMARMACSTRRGGTRSSGAGVARSKCPGVPRW